MSVCHTEFIRALVKSDYTSIQKLVDSIIHNELQRLSDIMHSKVFPTDKFSKIPCFERVYDTFAIWSHLNGSEKENDILMEHMNVMNDQICVYIEKCKAAQEDEKVLQDVCYEGLVYCVYVISLLLEDVYIFAPLPTQKMMELKINDSMGPQLVMMMDHIAKMGDRSCASPPLTGIRLSVLLTNLAGFYDVKFPILADVKPTDDELKIYVKAFDEFEAEPQPQPQPEVKPGPQPEVKPEPCSVPLSIAVTLTKTLRQQLANPV